METEFNVPRLGERGDIDDKELPIDALRLCQNMMRSDRGRLVVRPGYSKISATNPGGRIMGLKNFRTATGVEKTVAANKTGLWQYDGSIWADITESGNVLTGGDTDHVRYQVFAVSGTYNIYLANGQDIPKVWNGSAANYSDVAASPGDAIDCKAAANRMLWLVAPDNIRVSEFNNPESLPTGNGFNVRLVDAGDIMVGMERFNKTSVGIYGDESQYVARAQSGSSPFRFEKVDEAPGPLSSAAIVKVRGAHYWLAEDCNVHRFDSVSVVPVGWAMKRFVESNINFSNRKMTHGVFLRTFQKIFWFFPGVGQTAPNLGIYFDVRTGEMGRLTFGASITASAQWRAVNIVTWADLTSFTWDNIAASYPTWDSFGAGGEFREILGDSNGNVHVIGQGDGSDDGAPINVQWEVPLKPYGGMERNFVPATFETWFKKSSNSVNVSLSVGHSDTYMVEPTFEAKGTFDLSVEQRNDIDIAGITEKRFVTVRHTATTDKGGIEWSGGILRGEATDLAHGPTNVENV